MGKIIGIFSIFRGNDASITIVTIVSVTEFLSKLVNKNQYNYCTITRCNVIVRLILQLLEILVSY